MHADVLGVEHQRGARFVQRAFGDQAVAVGIGEDGPFLVDVAIFVRIERDGRAGLAMTAQGHAQFQPSQLEQSRQQGESVGDGGFGRLGLGQCRQERGGERFSLLMVEDDLSILGSEIRTHHQADVPLPANQGREALGGSGERGRAEVAGDSVIAPGQAQNGQVEVMQQAAGGAAIARLPRMILER